MTNVTHRLAMKRGQTNAHTEKELNKRAIRQTFAGYARADKFIEAEKRAWLQSLTPKQAWAIFDELFSAWEYVAANRSESRQRMEELRLGEKVTLRHALDRAAKKSKRR